MTVRETPDTQVSDSAVTSSTATAGPHRERQFDVVFVVDSGAELVDIAGPWGVFEYATHASTGRSPFALSSVAATAGPLVLSGGMRVVPDRTFAECDHPDIVVVPAMGSEADDALLNWLRAVHPTAMLTMSVCNGAFVIAAAGLLDGRTATCHHGGYGAMRAMFPKVTVQRGVRWVDHGDVATAGGLTSGTDLALHVVERLLGPGWAERTAKDLEYFGDGWHDPSVNAAFAAVPVAPPAREIDPICEYAVDPAEAVVTTWDGRDYFFCGEWCRDLFLKAPDRVTAVD